VFAGERGEDEADEDGRGGQEWEEGEGAACLLWSPGEFSWARPMTPRLGKMLAEVGRASTPSSLCRGTMSNTTSVYRGETCREAYSISISNDSSSTSIFTRDFYVVLLRNYRDCCSLTHLGMTNE